MDNGVPERRLVFARDLDPQAWLNLQQLATQVRQKVFYCLHLEKPGELLMLLISVRISDDAAASGRPTPAKLKWWSLSSRGKTLLYA
jgi:hypothetical protein